MSALKGRAVTPEQKRVIMERVLAAWLKCPELRLGQFVYIAAENGSGWDLFYTEDDAFAAMMENEARALAAPAKDAL